MLQWIRNNPFFSKILSAPVRNVIKLVGGTAASQLVAFSITPLLTRLYDPASFGILTAFSSALAIVSVISSLSYELAITTPKSNDDALEILRLCLILVAASSATCALVIYFDLYRFVGVLNQAYLSPFLWLLPLGLFLSGTYQALSLWSVRQGMFNILAKVKVRQSIMGALISVSSAPFGAVGLILGQIANQSSGVLTLLRYSPISLWPVRSYDFYSILMCMKKYKNFPKFSCPAGLVNVLGNQLPYIILLSYYGPSQLGQLALADKILLLPAGLLGNSVGQVFLNEASQSYRDGNLQKLLLRTAKKLTFLAIGSAFIVALIVCPFVPLIFGQRWTESKDLILLAIPLFCGKLIVSPISMCFLIAQRNKQELVGQIMLLLLRSAPLLVMAYLGYSFHRAFLAYSVFSLIGYFGYGILAYYSSKYIDNCYYG